MSMWLVTGCSTGLGRHLAEAVPKRGFNAVITACDRSKVSDLAEHKRDTVLALPLDRRRLARGHAGRSLRGASTKIADYEGMVGPRREENEKAHGTQAVYPARAAEAMIDAVALEAPPFRLLLGKDALAGASAELDERRGELEAFGTLDHDVLESIQRHERDRFQEDRA